MTDAPSPRCSSGSASPTLGSSIDLLIGLSFKNVETLDPDAKHRHYRECGCCGGTDENREHYKPDINKVEHKDECPLARDLPILRAIGLASDAGGVAQAAPDRKTLDELIQRHASAYVARGGAISDSIVAECKASREALLAAFAQGQSDCGEVEQLQMQVAGTKAGRDFHIDTASELLALLTGIIEAESEFRDSMGKSWEGDPLSDAIDAARRFINLEAPAPQPLDPAYSSQQPRLAERLTDVITMLDTPDAYNREYIAAVCRSILSSVSSTQCAIAVCTCRPGPCQFPSTDRLCPDCGRSIDGPTHAAYCAVASTPRATPIDHSEEECPNFPGCHCVDQCCDGWKHPSPEISPTDQT